MPRITFVETDGNEKTVDAPLGLTVMEVATRNDIDIEAACGGSLACATCHLIVADQDRYDKLEERSEEEEDMLDLAFDVTATSRLSCQIKVTEEIDGIVFKVPS